MRCSSVARIGRNEVPWDDAIVVSAGKLRKLWDSLSELRSSLCERRLKRTVLRHACLLTFSGKYDVTSKLAQFDWDSIAHFKDFVCSLVFTLNNTSNLWFYIAFVQLRCLIFLFRCARKITKSDYWLRNACLLASPSARKNSVPNGRIFMKFDIWIFFVNL